MGIVKNRQLVLLAVLVAMATAAAGVSTSQQQLPLYFGFFPASNTTELALKQLASAALQEALAIDEVRRLYCQYTNHSLDTPVANLTRFAYSNPTLDLHVTAYYCNYGAVPGCASYAASPAVAAALGRQFALSATALLLTPRTLGFRVDLGNDGALAVWANGEGEAAPGQRAHFTVATSPGVPAVQTGLDLLAVANRVGRPVGGNGSSRVLHFQQADFLLLLSPASPVPAVFRASDNGGNGGARAGVGGGYPAAWAAMLAASAWRLLGQRLQAAALRLLDY